MRWDIRVESGNDATYYAEVSGKLARVAAFGARYRIWDYGNRAPTADELHANDKVVVRNSPRVTRTLMWNPKTHSYEE